jgi:hypothetical protein
MRRFALGVLATSVLVAVVATGRPALAAPSDDWLQSGHDAGHTYANRGESVLDPATVAKGLTRTSVDIGLIDVGQPLVSDASVYATSNAWDFETGRLERWDIASEKRVWLTDLLCFGPPFLSGQSILIDDTCGVSQPAPPRIFSTVDGLQTGYAKDYFGFTHRGVAYLTSGPAESADGIEVKAMRVATRKVLWTLPGAPTGPLGRPLLAAGNTLYIQRGTTIEARGADTGALLWDRTPTRSVTPLAAVGDALYVRWDDGTKRGIARWRASDAGTDWSVGTQGSFAFTPHVIYQSGPADELRARSTDSGKVLWDRTGFQFDSIQQPVYADGVIWAMEGPDIVAFDASTGDQLGFWYLAPATTFAVAEGHVFVPSPDGRLFILSPKT